MYTVSRQEPYMFIIPFAILGVFLCRAWSYASSRQSIQQAQLVEHPPAGS